MPRRRGRWGCRAWLHRLDIGEALLAHLLVDVGHTRQVAPSGLVLLERVGGSRLDQVEDVLVATLGQTSPSATHGSGAALACTLAVETGIALSRGGWAPGQRTLVLRSPRSWAASTASRRLLTPNFM